MPLSHRPGSGPGAIAVRTAGDTVQGAVIPVSNGAPCHPVAGTVVRSMVIVGPCAVASPKTSTRRELVTYGGSDTAKITFTEDGAARSCTLPLPRGRIIRVSRHFQRLACAPPPDHL